MYAVYILNLYMRSAIQGTPWSWGQTGCLSEISLAVRCAIVPLYHVLRRSMCMLPLPWEGPAESPYWTGETGSGTGHSLHALHYMVLVPIL